MTKSYLMHQVGNKYSLFMNESVGLGGRIARALLDDFKEHINITNRNKRTLNFALEIFLYNCYKAIELQKLHSSIEIVVNYSRSKDEYKKIYRYFPYKGWKSLKQIVDTAITLGYITGQTGFKAEKHSKRSYFQPTEKMAAFLNQYNPQDFAQCIEKLIKDTIILKKDKKLMDYTDTITTNKYRANLKVINDVISNHSITLFSKNLLPNISLSSSTIPILYSSTTHQLHIYGTIGISKGNRELRGHRAGYSLMSCSVENDIYNLANIASYRRVFTETFERGGRLYCGLQNLPKEYRALIQIDEASTTSFDYSGMHINMLYNIAGLDMSDVADPYDLGPTIARKTAKKAFLILINAASERSAASSMRENMGIKYADGRALIAAFKAKHKPIANFICSGEGIKLQYMDSIIAEQIMVHFARKDEVCFGIHDGFIVRDGLGEELKDVMCEAYYQEMGFYCKIKKEY